MFGSKGPEKVDEVPPFDQLIMPGQVGYEDPVPEGALNNKLSGLRSYRIEDNPKYAKLFPEVIGGDHGKTPTKAPKTQNMA
jgi:DNA-directed RNA polymerase II subunit RPB7